MLIAIIGNMTTKEIILKELNEHKNQIISGEYLAEKCGVSRAAVWKAVNSLRAENCNIAGTTNGGYILNGVSDIFSQELMEKEFYKKFPEYKSSFIECFKEIDSTNTYAKHLLTDCGALRTIDGKLTKQGSKYHKSIFVAESQTAGRGRSGRVFVSPDKTGIYLSIVYAPEGGISHPAKFTAFSAVAVCRALKNLFDLEAQIKWINDIFYKGKKISGILTEGVANFETGTIESAIIGIGINIEKNKAFNGKLKNIAGSILENSEENKLTNGRVQLAAEIAGQVLKILEEDEKKVMEEYKSLSFIIGKEVEVHSLIDSTEGIYTATVIGIGEDAGLVVKLTNGSFKTLVSGEVSLKSDSFVNNSNER